VAKTARHGHPEIRRPITLARLGAELAWIWSRGNNLGDARPVATFSPHPRLVISELLEATHSRNSRRYAEAEVRRTAGGQRRAFVYVAPSFLYLPAKNRLGLLAHECGHLLLLLAGKKHSERDADEVSAEWLGILVSYDGRWRGKGLQAGRRLW
jgi:hypothetical protein